MREIFLVAALLCIFVFCYFLAARLDRFVAENRNSIKKTEEKKEPSCVMLTDNLPEEELTEQIRRFKQNHKATRIMLYGDEKKETDTEKKR